MFFWTGKKQLIEGLSKLRAHLCRYVVDPCDCKYGCDGLDDRRSEQSGCPEVRAAIALLNDQTDDEGRAAPRTDYLAMCADRDQWKARAETAEKTLAKDREYLARLVEQSRGRAEAAERFQDSLRDAVASLRATAARRLDALTHAEGLLRETESRATAAEAEVAHLRGDPAATTFRDMARRAEAAEAEVVRLRESERVAREDATNQASRAEAAEGLVARLRRQLYDEARDAFGQSKRLGAAEAEVDRLRKEILALEAKPRLVEGHEIPAVAAEQRLREREKARADAAEVKAQEYQQAAESYERMYVERLNRADAAEAEAARLRAGGGPSVALDALAGCQDERTMLRTRVRALEDKLRETECPSCGVVFSYHSIECPWWKNEAECACHKLGPSMFDRLAAAEKALAVLNVRLKSEREAREMSERWMREEAEDAHAHVRKYDLGPAGQSVFRVVRLDAEQQRMVVSSLSVRLRHLEAEVAAKGERS